MASILDHPLSAGEVRSALRELASGDATPQTKHIASGRFDISPDVATLAREAYLQFIDENALWWTIYPSIAAMEKDVVQAGIELLRGNAGCRGNFTSGGTESIMLAVKAARDYCRAKKPQITRPNIVLPVTAHPAFHKAAHYLGVETVMTEVETQGFRAEPESFRNAIDEQTILCVGSAPNFSHGTVDPIATLSEIARERGILFHVDGCVGGLYLSHLRMLGRYDQPFDFSLPGVTSISADLHKYGYAPKNASLVLYRTPELRQHAWYINSATTDYIVFNTTVQSTRTAGSLAAAWATLRYLGNAGYMDIVQRVQDKTAEIVGALRDNPHLHVMGDPDMAMFTIASDTLNIFELSDAMHARDWILTPQFAMGGGPENLHVNVTEGLLDRMDRFVSDITGCAEQLARDGSSIDMEKIRAAVSAAAGKPLPQMLAALLPLAGLGGTGLPTQQAPLNSIMNLLPPAARDQAFLFYLNTTL